MKKSKTEDTVLCSIDQIENDCFGDILILFLMDEHQEFRF